MINYDSAAGPFAHSENSSVRIMYRVIASLLPALLVGIYHFGINGLSMVMVCCLVAVISEYLCLKLMGRDCRACIDGSALLTALLLAMSLPPTVPLWLCAVGTVFAIVVGKQIYGGLGQNLFNPAMLARVMLLICFPLEMSQWAEPTPIGFTLDQINIPGNWLLFDGVSAATVLGESSVTPSLGSLALGSHAGSLGETSAILILLGGVYLIYRRIIHWAIPVSFIAGLALPALISSTLAPSDYLSMPEHLLSGGAMLCAFYIATDLVTSPSTVKGQLIYGAGCGALVWLIRSYGSYPEGVAFAVLLLNAISPLIDHYVRPNLFGSQVTKEGVK